MMWQFGLKSNSTEIYATCAGRTLASFGVGMPVNAWHHVAITCDGTNARLYLDGALMSTKTFTLGTGTSSNLVIGAVQSDGSECFKGDLDEVYAMGDSLLAGVGILVHRHADVLPQLYKPLEVVRVYCELGWGRDLICPHPSRSPSV